MPTLTQKLCLFADSNLSQKARVWAFSLLWVQLQLGILSSVHYLSLITKLSSQTKGFPNSDASLSDFKCHSAHWFWQDDQLYWWECVCSVTQSCLTLCEPIDCRLPDFSIHGIFQARILEWVAISFSSEGRAVHNDPPSTQIGIF